MNQMKPNEKLCLPCGKNPNRMGFPNLFVKRPSGHSRISLVGILSAAIGDFKSSNFPGLLRVNRSRHAELKDPGPNTIQQKFALYLELSGSRGNFPSPI
jgi:hypothetical protein